MDSPSKSMYDTFKDQIWEELGPLDPNWFDALTVKASTDDGNVPEQHTLNTVNQDGGIKPSFEKSAVDSQLFSTPKIFRHSRVLSPETEDEQFSSAQEKETLPWTIASPCLFGTSKEGMSVTKSYRNMQPQEGFELLNTPQKSSVDFAQHISESLGAQINPNISWTSSLNTPPALPSTLILSKTEDSPCPVSLSADKKVIFVRKLFPSLSNVSRVTAVSPKKSGIPTVQQAIDCPGVLQGRNTPDSPQCSLNQSGSDWRQTLPDAIEDGEIRSTVASVLDGAENVLSIFFTNSNSALRRVKTDRIKRKQSISTKEHGCSSTDILTLSNLESSEKTGDQRADDQELGRVSSSPHLRNKVKTGDIKITQWSPMSLSDISHCTIDTSCHLNDSAKQKESNIVRDQLGSDSDPGQLVRSSFKNTDSRFTMKKRRFVYTVQSSKPQVEGKDPTAQKIESSPGNPVSGQELCVKQIENAPDEAQCYNVSKKTCDGKNEMLKQGNVAEENLAPLVPVKGQDLTAKDVSQLCRAFAQDFTPMSDLRKLGNVEEHTPGNGFSPSACLSALKQKNKRLLTNQESSQRGTSHHHDSNGISNKRHVPTTHLKNSKIESTMSDSGFQSTMADVTQMTASSSALPSSEKDAQSQPWPDFKTGVYRTRTTPFQPLTKEKGQLHLDDIMEGTVTDAKLSIGPVNQSQTLDPSTESTSTRQPSNAKGVVDKRNCIEQNGQVHACKPQQTTVSLPSLSVLGFKTASNRGIKVSSVNLERAKTLFKEIEGESPFNNKPTKCSLNTEDEIDMTHKSVENTETQNHPPSSEKCGDIHCPLTASQKADVSELCSLLEEADSQFEFTQFKPAKLNQDEAPPPQRVDKELDPDFLRGIDFDDSFSSDAENHLAKMMTPDKMTSIPHGKTNCKAPIIKVTSTGTSFCSAMKRGNASTGGVFSISKHTSEGLASIVSTKVINNFDITGQSGSDKTENKSPLTFGVGFKTAGGNVLSISKKCLSQARALFADLEENLVTISGTGNSSDLVMTNYKQAQKPPDQQSGEIDVKTKHQPSVDPNIVDNGHFLHIKEGDSESTGNYNVNTEERIQVCFSNVTESLSSEGRVPGIRSEEHTTKSNELENKKMNTTMCHGQKIGFQMASGKGITISAKAIQEANAFFKDCDVMESDDCMSVKHKKSIIPMTGGDMKKHSKGNIFEEPVNGCTEFENVNVGPVANHKMLHHDDEQMHNGGFKSPVVLRNAVSSHGNPSLTAKPLSSPLYTTSKSVGSSAICELSKAGGFCTASGKKVSVSDDALSKAKSLLNECDAFEEGNKQQKQKTDTLRTSHVISPIQAFPPQNGGFQTASGKGVAISTTALRKAKALLSEYDGVEDKKEMTPTHPNIPIHVPPPRNSGFFAASGKPVAFSAEALQKAKALFGDISSNTEIPAVSDTTKTEANHEDAQNNTEKINCSFTTARGTKVHVSETNIFKAKKLLNEFANGECSDSITTPRSYSTSSFDTCKSVTSKVNVLKTSNSNVTTASEKEVPIKEFAPQVITPSLSPHKTDNAKETLRNPDVSGYSFSTTGDKCDSVSEKVLKEAFKLKEGTTQGEDSLHGMPGEKRPGLVDCGMNQISSIETHQFTRTAGSSVLNFHSLDFSGCTDTQQKYFAQEAMDCTKALLEDEDLDGQSVTVTSEKMPLRNNSDCSKGSAETRKGIGKRSVEDADLTDQPPLKRRLLEEFDRIVDSPRALHPAKSCPDGVTKDRRVFKYSISLHPNITRPHRDGKNYVETRLQRTEQLLAKPHSSLGEGRPSQSKMAVFVPPFHKNLKTETLKSYVPQDKARTPAGFVPPFKKQRTTVQESSPKPQIKEDKLHHLYVMPTKTNSYVPPAKITQSPTKITDGKGKENIQTLALAETADGNVKSGQNLPFDHGMGDSAAEASGVEDGLSKSQDMVQDLQLARDIQDMRIRKKKHQTIQPLPGSLFLAKSSGVDRIPLKDAVKGRPPAQHTQKQLYVYGVHRHVSEITSETAESFRFDCQQFFKQEVFIDGGGVQLADGGWLIPRNNGTAGKEEFYRALCDTPGVDPKLISEEWLYNHYRWIVWKQASMERSFPSTMGSLCLTPEQVLLQLKYRYDVEVDHSRRPALRKIMEKDDTAAKTLVLCVCGVVSRGHDPTRQSRNDVKTQQGADSKVENPVAIIWLTDGWYAIKAQLDVPLTAMLHKGRLAIGGKLIIHGAELVGSQDACSPLEAPESIMLKICANSSRPARWDTKLGFYRDPRPFLLPVSCLYSNGGPVGCVDIVILRSYPTQWMERKPDGGFVFRCARAEEKEARRYNSSKQKAMEILSAKIQAEFEKEEKGNNKPRGRRQTLSCHDVESLQDGEELHEAVENDPLDLEAQLSEQQLETLHTYRRSLVEKRQTELQERYRRALENAQEENGSCPKRDVTPVWKLCVADSRDQLGGNVYLLNLWRPSMDLQSLLKEGCRHRVYNLTTSAGKKLTGSATLQLTVTKKTQFQDLQASQEWLSAHFQPRISANFHDLLNPECHPLCGEVDLVGYVIAIIDGQGPSPVLYLVDGKLTFVKVRCSSSLAQSGLEDMVKPLALLALSNLKLRAQSSSPVPVLYAGDLALFSTNPKEVHLQEAVSQLRNLVQCQENFFTSAEEKLSHFVQSDGPSSLQAGAPVCRTDRGQDTRTCVASQQPIRSFGSFTPLSRNPLPAYSSADKDPKSLKRRRALDYLSHIASPPPLCPVGTMASPCVNKTFNPPRRSGTPSTLKTVQTQARKSVISPVVDEWVKDEELAMIDTQALHVGNSGT